MLVDTDLNFLNHQGPQFQIKCVFTVLLKIKDYQHFGLNTYNSN